jgi:anti-anti-sigma regulatory factor
VDVIDSSALRIRLEGKRVIFALVHPDKIEMGLPPNFELKLGPEVRAQVDQAAEVALDLEQTPAIGSRQLGVMLALHRALRHRFSKLKLLNAHQNVRRLLELSRTSQFFELS